MLFTYKRVENPFVVLAYTTARDVNHFEHYVYNDVPLLLASSSRKITIIKKPLVILIMIGRIVI